MDSKSNRLFGAFFCLSVFLHCIVITVVPVQKLLKTGTPTLEDASAKESDTVTLEFELESPPEVSNIEEEEPLQEKRLNFVDTSDSPIDEEPQGDTDKIGVKGTAARDTYEGEEEVNNQPRMEGNSTGLFLSEGASLFDEPFSEGAEEQDEPAELTRDDLREPVIERSEEKRSQLSETEVVVSPPQSTDESLNDLQQEEKEGDSDEDKEGLENVEKPTLLAQLSPEASGMKPVEIPLELEELEDKGEMAPLATPPQRQKMRQESIVKKQEFENPPSIPPLLKGERGIDSRPRTQVPSGKKIIRGAKKGSPVIYEDSISNAPLHGEEAFSVKRHEYAEYFQHIRNKIAWYWFLSYGHDQSIKLETKHRLPIIIEFKVLPSGRTGDVKIIDEAGNQLLAARIQLAIETTRLDIFPPYIEEEFIDVRFNFYFF